MDSHEQKDSDSSTPDTSHLASSSAGARTSRKKLVVTLVVLVVVVAAAVGGWLWYSKVQSDQKAADDAAKASQTKELTPEEQITEDLKKNIKKQEEALKQGDDTKYLTESTAAATSVGRNLHEDELKD